MAGKEVLSLCKFSESQVEQFQNLEKQMKEKWNLGLRWDSKVPSKDKWLLYFFTIRGLDREKICKDLKDFEKKFQDINTEIQKMRGGKNIDPKQVQLIREKFEKVITDMKYINEDTDSSTIYKATRDVLAKEDDVFRWFDNVEIVQSRKELQLKKNQLLDLKEEEKNKDEAIFTLEGFLREFLEKEPKQAEKIRMLNDQIKDNKEKFSEFSDVIVKLMRKMKYMPFDRSDSDPYEYGAEMQNLVEINLSIIHKLNELSVLFEGFRLRENKRESKLENLDQILRISSEIFVSKDLNAMKNLISNFLSTRKGSDPNETSIKKGAREGGNNETPTMANDALKSGEDTDDDAVKDFLENQLTSSYAQSKEMRYECSELMKLMAQMVLNADGCRAAKVNGIVIEIILALNKYMRNKLVAFVDLLKIFRSKEIERDDTVENLENQLTVNLNQITEEINSVISQMNSLL